MLLVLVFFHRTSVHSSTGFTPFLLMHFREAKLPIHVKIERATGEGPKELPTESKMLESTRALINLQDEYHTRAAHNIARDTMRVEISPVQQQAGSTDCGLFTIAFATDLA